MTAKINRQELVIKPGDIGRWIRLYFTDTGAVDCILIDFSAGGVTVYDLGDNRFRSEGLDQVICLGPRVLIPKF